MAQHRLHLVNGGSQSYQALSVPMAEGVSGDELSLGIVSRTFCHVDDDLMAELRTLQRRMAEEFPWEIE